MTTADPCVATAPASLGRAVRTVAIDRSATLVIYDHDIAQSFTHTLKELC